MPRMMIVPLVLLAAIICCMGQTFQYSRGWTNGKRSNSHFREDTGFPDLIEMETEKKLEKCLLNLQRIIHNPFMLHSTITNSGGTGSLSGNINKFPNGHHQSNEILEEINGPENVEFIKRQS